MSANGVPDLGAIRANQIAEDSDPTPVAYHYVFEIGLLVNAKTADPGPQHVADLVIEMLTEAHAEAFAEMEPIDRIHDSLMEAQISTSRRVVFESIDSPETTTEEEELDGVPGT